LPPIVSSGQTEEILATYVVIAANMQGLVWVPLVVAAHTNPAVVGGGLLPAHEVIEGLLRQTAGTNLALVDQTIEGFSDPAGMDETPISTRMDPFVRAMVHGMTLIQESTSEKKPSGKCLLDGGQHSLAEISD